MKLEGKKLSALTSREHTEMFSFHSIVSLSVPVAFSSVLGGLTWQVEERVKDIKAFRVISLDELVRVPFADLRAGKGGKTNSWNAFSSFSCSHDIKYTQFTIFWLTIFCRRTLTLGGSWTHGHRPGYYRRRRPSTGFRTWCQTQGPWERRMNKLV